VLLRNKYPFIYFIFLGIISFFFKKTILSLHHKIGYRDHHRRNFLKHASYYKLEKDMNSRCLPSCLSSKSISYLTYLSVVLDYRVASCSIYVLHLSDDRTPVTNIHDALTNAISVKKML